MIVLTYKEKKGDEEGGSEGRRKAERKRVVFLIFILDLRIVSVS